MVFDVASSYACAPTATRPRLFDAVMQQIARLRPRPGGEAGYLEWDADRWRFALLRVWVGRAACGWGVIQAFEMWARGWGMMGLVRAFEIWASQAVLIGTLAESPHRQQFTCEWCAQGWYKGGMGCENPAKGRYSRVFPCVESVRGWHMRGRYEDVPGMELDLDPHPNPVHAGPLWPVQAGSIGVVGEWGVRISEGGVEG